MRLVWYQSLYSFTEPLDLCTIKNLLLVLFKCIFNILQNSQELVRKGSTGLVLSCCQVWLLATPWTVACQAPLSMDFSRQEYWSGLPFPLPVDLPDPGNQTWVSCVSCIGRQILYHWATWETQFRACLLISCVLFPWSMSDFPIRLWKQGQVLYTLPPLNT